MLRGMSHSEGQTCIRLRLRRVVVEDAYVAVPLTAEIMRDEPEPDGSHRLDFDRFAQAAVALSGNAGVDWRAEERTTQVHPTQGPVPEGRVVYDIHTQSGS